MKKRWLILTAVVLLGFLTACGTNDDKSEDTPPSITEPATATFEGTIEEINGQSALISIEDGQILSSGDKVTVDLAVASEDSFEIGDQVRVGYDGSVRETYPLQIDTLALEKIN